MEKDKGQELYEADLLRKPNYSNGEPRPSWDQFSETAKNAWRKDAEEADDDGA